jgi:hypothetical protein
MSRFVAKNANQMTLQHCFDVQTDTFTFEMRQTKQPLTLLKFPEDTEDLRSGVLLDVPANGATVV